MGIDYYNCDACKRIFPDCSDQLTFIETSEESFRLCSFDCADRCMGDYEADRKTLEDRGILLELTESDGTKKRIWFERYEELKEWHAKKQDVKSPKAVLFSYDGEMIPDETIEKYLDVSISFPFIDKEIFTDKEVFNLGSSIPSFPKKEWTDLKEFMEYMDSNIPGELYGRFWWKYITPVKVTESQESVVAALESEVNELEKQLNRKRKELKEADDAFSKLRLR